MGSTFDTSVEYARVDLVSNHTIFQNDRLYQALVLGEQLPVHTFSSFIHEATHHWCFISPVGTALSLLYLSVARRVLRWAATGDDSKLDGALEDLCAFEVAVKWLRPLNEGLAQFAEYDVRPDVVGSASLISTPLLGTLTHLFNLPRRLPSSQAADPTPALYELADDIDRWRLSRQTIERKSELLLQPIGSHGSAYLLGYLTVKSLWRNAARVYRELESADLFMLFLRKLVFGDYALVAAILDRSRPGFERGLRLGEQVYDRLDVIRQLPVDDNTTWSEWEEILRPSPTGSGGGFVLPDGEPFAALDTQDQVRDGVKRLSGLFRKMVEPAEGLDLPPGKFPPDFFNNVLHERYLMWLGESPARWESTGPRRGRVVMGSDIVVEDFKLEHASDEGLGDLRLDIYVDLYEDYQFTTVSSERGVFGFVLRQTASDASKAELLSSKLDRRQIAAVTRLLRESMPHYLRGTNFRERLDEFWRADGNTILDATYTGFAFDFNEGIGPALANGGIASVLNGDPELVRALAAVTLATSAGMTPEQLQASCPELPIAPHAAIHEISARWDFDDFPLADIGDDGYLRSSF